MINSNDILKYMEEKNINTSIKEIESLILKEDREEMSKVQADRFKYEIWDKKSPINGVSAKEIIKSRDYAISNAYLIYIDGALVYFQDHNPNESGFVKMNKSEATKIAKEFIDKKIEENVDNIITSNVIKSILSK